MVFCSPDGQGIHCMEGYSVNVDMAVTDLKEEEIGSFVIPGGDISPVNNSQTHALLKRFKERGVLIAGICAGVDVLSDAGILNDVRSTHSDDLDVVVDLHTVTARANAYVDFAIAVAKELDLFEDEADLQETIDFWKYHKRVQG